jgi:Zn-dependent M32 family carboxypeptidase
VGVTAEDIPQGWMDDMIKRLFDELNRQLIRIEDKAKRENQPDETPEEEATDARKLANLQRALERLTQMEMQRQSLRETKVGVSDDDARLALERRLDQRLAAIRAQRTSEGSQSS